MSVSEDCELQELVKQTLEKSGSMSKIRAELRASVFLALEDNGCFQNMKTQNISLQNFSKTTDGVLLLCLIREFLEYFGLSFTASVFDPELASYGIYCNCKDRSKLSNQLNVSSNPSEEADGPVLNQVLKVIRNLQTQTKNQKNNPHPIEEINNLQNCKSSDTSTEYLPLQRSTNTVQKETETSKQTENESERNKNPLSNTITESKKMNESKGKSTPIQVANEKDTEAPKYNLSSLDDLPPLTSSFNSSKSNNSSFSKSKQINMLKAALKDTISETNDDFSSSVASENDNDQDPEDSAKFNDSIAEESHITAEDLNSS